MFSKVDQHQQRSVSTLSVLLLLLSYFQCGVICEQSVSSSILNNDVVGLPPSSIVSSSINTANNNDNSKQHTSSFVASGPTPGDEYRASYFYPASHHPQHHGVNWNRDTYADAASEFGYNQQQQQHHQHQGAATNPGAVYAPAYGSTGESEGYEDSLGLGSSLGGIGGGLGGLGGLGGVAGILGIKGLKGLGLLGLFKAAIPILAILLPALLLIPLILLFFPVPVITVPATGQRGLMNAFNLGEISGKMTNLARSVLESDKCMERISCEMSRVSRGSFIDRTLKRVLPRFEPHMPQVLKRFARVFMEQPGGTSCNKKYNCYLMDDSSSTSSAKKSTPS